MTDAIELLTKLVSIASPSLHEAKAAAYLAGWMNAHGLRAHVDAVGNAVGVKGSGQQEILLLGHIDTFPGEVPLRREGDILFGRGSVDAKGPLCTFAAATSQVIVPPDWRITVVGAVEEEYATSRGARYILQQRTAKDTPDNLPQPTYCIIGEPSNWDRITLGYKGRLLMEIDLRVPFSHSAGEGDLPAEQGVNLWQAIKAHCDSINEAADATSPFSQLAPSLRHISSQDEGAFGTVNLGLGFRLPVGITPEALEQQLRGITTTHLAEGTTAALTFSGGELAYKSSKSNPLVRAFLASIRSLEGTPRFVVKTGTADMNVVGPHWTDTPIVAYGPGDSSLDHTPNEHIDLNEYQRAVEVLSLVLHNLMA
jgi:LysW-gamma-L-lysine carboxypeptidase